MNALRKTLIVLVVLSIFSLSCGFLSSVRGLLPSNRASAPFRQEQITDSSGIAVFDDPGSDDEVVVTVLDKGKVLPEAEVTYLHGRINPFEFFLVRDNRGLLAAEFFLHNSEHTIEVIRGEIRPLNPDQERAMAGYLVDTGGVSRSAYMETISNAEMKERMSRLERAADVMLFFIGKFPGWKEAVKFFLGPASDAIGLLSDYEDPNLRWDRYEVYDAESGSTSIVFVKSQPPLMQSPALNVGEGGRVILSLLAIDPIDYSSHSTQLAGMPDFTIFEGPTDFSDLAYYYELEDGQGHLINSGIQEKTSVCTDYACVWTEMNLGVLAAGEYYIRLWAEDEVKNNSLPVEFAFEVTQAGQTNQNPPPPITEPLVPPIQPPAACVPVAPATDTPWNPGKDPSQSEREYYAAHLVQLFQKEDVDEILSSFGILEPFPLQIDDTARWASGVPIDPGSGYSEEEMWYDISSVGIKAFLRDVFQQSDPACLAYRPKDSRDVELYLGPIGSSYLRTDIRYDMVIQTVYVGNGNQFCLTPGWYFSYIVAYSPDMNPIDWDVLPCPEGESQIAEFDYTNFDDFSEAVVTIIENWDPDNPEPIIPLLYDPVHFWGCWGQCEGENFNSFYVDRDGAAYDFLPWSLGQASEGNNFSVLQGDSTCFPLTPAYADNSIWIRGSQAQVCIGFSYIGGRYYITDIWQGFD